VPEDVIEQIEGCNTPWCWIAGRLLRRGLERWKGPVSPPDAAAVGVAIAPEIAQAEMCSVVVETLGRHTRGMTVVDRRRSRGDLVGEAPNTSVVEHIDTGRHVRLITDTLVGGEHALDSHPKE
jgi:hypothetical protein